MRLLRLFRISIRALVLVIGLGLPSCKSPPTPPPARNTASDDAGPALPEARSADLARAFLEPTMLVPDFHPGRLYSWTTTEQAEEIRRAKRLLLRAGSPEHGASRFTNVVVSMSQKGDSVASLLRSTAFRKARFAWTSAWATRMGWPDEHYGDVLLSVTLRPESYVARLDGASKWSVTTTEGTAARVDDVVAHPERLAAVIFENEATPSYREVVLCNESRVNTFSFGTPAELGRLDEEIRGLEAVATATESGSRLAVEELFKANVAFRNSFYELDAVLLRKIATSLRSVQNVQPSAASFESSVEFVRSVPIPAPPPSIERRTIRNGTYQ